MDNAVALVQAYLNLNGYFTVTEYPVLEMQRGRHFRVVTDLDILAFRFPQAGRQVIGDAARTTRFETDPELRCPVGQSDMIIGEVKEGRAELNRGARNSKVVAAVLARFGCCSADTVAGVVETLLRDGHAVTGTDHRVRLIAFGSLNSDGNNKPFESIELGHVIAYLQSYLREHWEVLRHAQFKHPAFGFLMTLEKALRHGGGVGA